MLGTRTWRNLCRKGVAGTGETGALEAHWVQQRMVRAQGNIEGREKYENELYLKQPLSRCSVYSGLTNLPSLIVLTLPQANHLYFLTLCMYKLAMRKIYDV